MISLLLQHISLHTKNTFLHLSVFFLYLRQFSIINQHPVIVASNTRERMIITFLFLQMSFHIFSCISFCILSYQLEIRNKQLQSRKFKFYVRIIVKCRSVCRINDCFCRVRQLTETSFRNK